MKKKLFIGLAGIVAIAAAVCVTATSVNHSSTSDLMTQNIEALSQTEGTAVADCWARSWATDQTFVYACNDYTTSTTIYPCPSSETYMSKGTSNKCTK